MRFTTVLIFALLAIGVAATPVSSQNGLTLHARDGDSDDELEAWKQSGLDWKYQHHKNPEHGRKPEHDGKECTNGQWRPSHMLRPVPIRYKFDSEGETA
ncbi:hypothetical protein PspLS_10317 [Pyricularia sp. CBS 133598]|nr:hypothetical protein PspLS_10317 [Pyricularia sp. CBS 133598]